MNIRAVAVLVVLLGGVLAIVVPVYLSRTNAEVLPALPTEATWTVRFDTVLDGEIVAQDGKIGGLTLRLAVHNNRVTGVPLASAQYADHRITGELTPGAMDILFLRQDGPAHYVSYYTARRVGAGRFVGTWIDNRGGGGDFDLVQEQQ